MPLEDRVSEARLELRGRLAAATDQRDIESAIRWAYRYGLPYELVGAEVRRREHLRRVSAAVWFVLGGILLLVMLLAGYGVI